MSGGELGADSLERDGVQASLEEREQLLLLHPDVLSKASPDFVHQIQVSGGSRLSQPPERVAQPAMIVQQAPRELRAGRLRRYDRQQDALLEREVPELVLAEEAHEASGGGLGLLRRRRPRKLTRDDERRVVVSRERG